MTRLRQSVVVTGPRRPNSLPRMAAPRPEPTLQDHEDRLEYKSSAATSLSRMEGGGEGCFGWGVALAGVGPGRFRGCGRVCGDVVALPTEFGLVFCAYSSDLAEGGSARRRLTGHG